MVNLEGSPFMNVEAMFFSHAIVSKNPITKNQRRYLVGGGWNHGILNDFPYIVGNFIIPTDVHYSLSVGLVETTNQPLISHEYPIRFPYIFPLDSQPVIMAINGMISYQI